MFFSTSNKPHAPSERTKRINYQWPPGRRPGLSRAPGRPPDCRHPVQSGRPSCWTGIVFFVPCPSLFARVLRTRSTTSPRSALQPTTCSPKDLRRLCVSPGDTMYFVEQRIRSSRFHGSHGPRNLSARRGFNFKGGVGHGKGCARDSPELSTPQRAPSCVRPEPTCNASCEGSPEHDLLPLPWAEDRSRRPENKKLCSSKTRPDPHCRFLCARTSIAAVKIFRCPH